MADGGDFEGGRLRKMSGNYHYCSDTETYHYVKKTGYLVKSPSSAGKIGRWRRRWCKLVDMVKPDTVTNTSTRHVRLEYYTTHPKNKTPKMKGAINLHSCIAVVSHEKKMRGYSYVMNIIMANVMVYHLAAGSEEERDQWITALNEFIFKKPSYSQVYFGKARGSLVDSVYTDFLTSSYYDGRLSQITHSQSVTVQKNAAEFVSERRHSNPASMDRAKTFVSAWQQEAARNSNLSEEDKPHSYESIGNDFQIKLDLQQSTAASEHNHWNDHPQSSSCDSLLKSGSPIKKSNSTQDMHNGKIYVLRLPHVDNAILNTRWSLSSAEDEENGGEYLGLIPTVSSSQGGQLLEEFPKPTQGSVEDLTSLGQSSPRSEDSTHYDSTLLNSEPWKGTGEVEEEEHQYYNIPAKCKSWPRKLANSSSQSRDEKRRILSVPQKKPIPKTRSKKPPQESNSILRDFSEEARQQEDSSVPSIKARQQEPKVLNYKCSPPVSPRRFKSNTEVEKRMGNSITPKSQSSPPVSPRKLKSNKTVQDRGEFPGVERNMGSGISYKPRSSPPVSPRRFKSDEDREANRKTTKTQLTKVLSVPNCSVSSFQQSNMQAQITSKLEVTNKASPKKRKESNSSDEQFLHRVTPETHKGQHTPVVQRSANVDAQEQAVLLLAARHKPSGRSRFGGTETPYSHASEGVTTTEQYVLTTKPTNQEAATSSRSDNELH